MPEQIFVVSGSVSSLEDMTAAMKLPKFRKATRAMAHAFTAVQKIVDQIPVLLAAEHRPAIGMVMGSSHGELEVTAQFLEHIAKQNVARPILFQNSLHNSTLGYLTVAFQLTGAAMTVSNGQFSGEDALDTACVLLREGDCDLCFALGYELLVPALEGVRDQFYPPGLKRGEGAGAVLLANSAGMERLAGEIAPVAELRGISCTRSPSSDLPPLTDPSGLQGFYDANGVAEFVRFLHCSDQSEQLDLAKPNGGWARLQVKRL